MSLISSPFGMSSHRNTSSLSYYSKVTTLPKISHPSTLANDGKISSLDIRGQSKLSQREPNRVISSLSNEHYEEQIPSHVEVTIGEDRDKLRLPIFGRRPSSISNQKDVGKEQSGPMSAHTDSAELESILREKVRSQMSDIRMKFRHSVDFDSNGRVSIQAFKHILNSIFGTQRQVSPYQIEQLLRRLQLKDRTRLSFDDFLHCLSLERESRTSLRPRPLSPSEEYLTKRTAGQMFLILKDKARTKNDILVRLCPPITDGTPSKIFKSQLSDALIDMGYRMNEKEFDKLWNKFDPDGFAVINSQKFLHRLNNEHFLVDSSPSARSESQDQQSAILQAPFLQRSSTDSKKQLEATTIGTWLKVTLPQCVTELEQDLKKSDKSQSGQISSKIFLQLLKHHGLSLEEHLLDFFFEHFNLPSTSAEQMVNYLPLLQALRQKIPSTKKTTETSSAQEVRQTPLEKQVEYLIASNYVSLYEKMLQLDRNNEGTVDSNAMRSFIEDLLEFPLRHDEYQQLLHHLPKNDLGKVLYRKYFEQIRERCANLYSIKEKILPSKKEDIPQWEYMRSNNIRERLQQESFREQQRRKEKVIDDYKGACRELRSVEQLREICKTLIRTRPKDIEQEFRRMDVGSYGELTPDYLYRLLKRFAVQPEVSPEEIQVLWSKCHLKENGTLDFEQFFRQFGYSKKSAQYPNAKMNPPRRGDRDFLLTSNKLYADSILVQETTRHAIRAHWDQFKQEFLQLDPYRTGFVHEEEFEELLMELCPQITQDDLQLLKNNKLDNTKDLRINYIQFLKQHAPNAQSIENIDTSGKRLSTTLPNNTLQTSADRATLKDELASKLRRQLSYSYKEVRRSFKQEDITNCGSVPVSIFKRVLNGYKCSLNDEQFYVLISELDTKMNGAINYNYFLQHYVKHN